MLVRAKRRKGHALQLTTSHPHPTLTILLTEQERDASKGGDKGQRALREYVYVCVCFCAVYLCVEAVNITFFSTDKK